MHTELNCRHVSKKKIDYEGVESFWGRSFQKNHKECCVIHCLAQSWLQKPRVMRRKRQSKDGILGAFQLAGLFLAVGLLTQPIREGILFSGAMGIGFTVFILLGALVVAIYRFIRMQHNRFPKNPPAWRAETGFGGEFRIDQGPNLTTSASR